MKRRTQPEDFAEEPYEALALTLTPCPSFFLISPAISVNYIKY
jgi:hypothetical protein